MSDQFIGKYQVLSELGRGAMGVVFRALDPTIDRQVAIKVIRTPAFSSHEETAQLRMRLMREARAAGRLSHPNIVTVHALEEHHESLYVVMEFVEGQSLDQYAASGKLSDHAEAIRILRQIADALDYAHSEGIIHRDIKPENMLIGRGGRVKLTDFGIAKIAAQKITQTGTTIGTPSYMSPEQIRAESLDGRADQYSLAVVAFELLTGRRPFEAPNLDALILKIVTENPPLAHDLNASLPTGCSKALLKGLAKLPEERYGTTMEFVADLSRCLTMATHSNKQEKVSKASARLGLDHDPAPAERQVNGLQDDHKPTSVGPRAVVSDLAGRRVKTIDNALSVFSRRDVNSECHILEEGSEIQLGAVSEFEGREWAELILTDASTGFALGASVRSHTNIPSDTDRVIRPLAPSPSWEEKPPSFRWGFFIAVVAGICAPLYIVWAVVGDSAAIRAAVGVLPWPFKVLLGAVSSVVCIGLLRRKRLGVIAVWAIYAINLMEILVLGIMGRLEPGIGIYQFVWIGVGLSINGRYFAKRWRFMKT